MSKVQISPPTASQAAANGTPAFSEPAQGGLSAFSPKAQAEPGAEGGTGHGAGLDEHSLLSHLSLSRPGAPQGRRSLFRR